MDRTSAPGLNELRADIDRIDGQLLRLVEERLSKTSAIAELKRSTDRQALLLRPDREAELLDRLKRDSRLPPFVVEAIWREIMACSLQMQQVTELALHGGKRPIAVVNLARRRFGCAAPIRVTGSPEEALERALLHPAIAVIELGPIGNWWLALEGREDIVIFDWLLDDRGGAVGLLIGRCDRSCLLPDLSFPIITGEELERRLAAGEAIRQLAASGDKRLCVSRARAAR